MSAPESRVAAPLEILHPGLLAYADAFAQMRAYTDGRQGDSADQLWFLEHPPVFTQGQAGKAEHLLMPGEIPVVQSDRGGQVTYHGPGQLVVYFLLDLHRLGFGIRSLVTHIEQSVVEMLAAQDIQGYADPQAPGIYVDDAQGRRMKIGSLGLRVRRGCTYHGLSLNVAMDLAPFQRINPCGYAGLRMTQLSELGGPDTVQAAGEALLPHLLRRLRPY